MVDSKVIGVRKTSMALDYGTNAKHSNEGINVNLTVYLSSNTT